ncbi:hypothetical protein ACFOZ0_30440 [Streptomyces yaanensis]|uniref:Uncharacterized protein n=1 Tax=Streptomyces yaanensis TaxID=1142239 RepID=A0ABV7SQD1_9ACTN|nr:hypothetical protein [Streptomyces sp. CGMCC 4.7035]WNC00337.1 hypothetical protein Q2K21_20970 [Streptomyces sp. CGMCC 4.7035]
MTGGSSLLADQADVRAVQGSIEQAIRQLTPREVRFTCASGRGGLDETAALFNKKADIAVVAPVAALRLLHQFGDLQGLFALGVVPRRGCLVAAADAALPLDTVADLADRADRMTIATPADDGVSLVGFAVHRALRLAGLGVGGLRFVYDAEPADCLGRYATGEADVVIHDMMSMPEWERAVAARPVRYLRWGDRVLHGFALQGWLPRVVRAEQIPLLGTDVTALDCSDFAVLCRGDLDDALARLIAEILIRGRRPAETAEVARTPLPLHPAAARAYAELVADVPLGSR